VSDWEKHLRITNRVRCEVGLIRCLREDIHVDKREGNEDAKYHHITKSPKICEEPLAILLDKPTSISKKQKV
jgi:hypothetical protein